MVQQLDIRHHVTTSSLHTSAVAAAAAVFFLDEAGASMKSAPPTHLAPDNTAYVIFTSGSTGVPKGVAVSHRAALSLAMALDVAVYRSSEPLQVSLNAPFSFDASVKQWLQVTRGRTLHCVAEEDRLSAERLLGWIRTQHIEVLDCTPTQLRGLRAAGLGAATEPLRFILCGGEAIDSVLWEWLRTLRGIEVHNLYGPTEFTVDATSGLVSAYDTPTIGRPLPDTRAHVLDAHGLLSPVGVPGELVLAGVRVARGYVGAPGRTAERFRPDSFAPAGGERAYRTGDLVSWQSDGTLAYRGRLDAQVQIRAVRVELGELEAIAQQEPGVAAAVAAVVPGDDDPELALWFVARDQGGEPERALAVRLRERLRTRLPVAMMPTWIVPIGALPTTRHGKVDRAALPDPRAASVDLAAPYVAPSTDLERRIAAVWEAVLERPGVGIHDNFFDVGGNSLLLVRLHARLQKDLGVEISLVELFRYSTVALLAERVGQNGAPGAEDARLAALAERARRQREAIEHAR
jgi:amino acid adenylation domain-containing protein